MTAFKKVDFVHGLNAGRDLFLANVKTNATRWVPTLQTGRAVLIAGGPSAADNLDDIRDHKNKGWQVWCVNGAHDWLLSHGIQPDACVVMDANDVADRFIREPIPSCRYYLASQACPMLFDRLIGGGFNVVMWHAFLGGDGEALITSLDPDATILVGFNTVGLHALSILCLIGMRKVRVYGMDSSHTDRDHAYDNPNHPVDEQDFWFQGKKYMSTVTWASQAVTFAKAYPLFADLGMKIEVIGDGLLPHMARVAKQRWLARLGAESAVAGVADGEGESQRRSVESGSLAASEAEKAA